MYKYHVVFLRHDQSMNVGPTGPDLAVFLGGSEMGSCDLIGDEENSDESRSSDLDKCGGDYEAGCADDIPRSSIFDFILETPSKDLEEEESLSDLTSLLGSRRAIENEKVLREGFGDLGSDDCSGQANGGDDEVLRKVSDSRQSPSDTEDLRMLLDTIRGCENFRFLQEGRRFSTRQSSGATGDLSSACQHLLADGKDLVAEEPILLCSPEENPGPADQQAVNVIHGIRMDREKVVQFSPRGRIQTNSNGTFVGLATEGVF